MCARTGDRTSTNKTAMLDPLSKWKEAISAAYTNANLLTLHRSPRHTVSVAEMGCGAPRIPSA
jgi:hypothetical protein